MIDSTPHTPRRDGRGPEDLRPISIERHYTRTAPGSVLIRAGETVVLCTASVDETLPPWMKKEATRGWVTAEYNMLPGSTSPRKPRERAGKIDGRTTEIQRLVGRSLRAVVNLDALGPRMITVDCDVLQADGGTRTLSITGGFIALVDAVVSLADKLPAPQTVFSTSVAAISLGLVDDRLLDCYWDAVKHFGTTDLVLFFDTEVEVDPVQTLVRTRFLENPDLPPDMRAKLSKPASQAATRLKGTTAFWLVASFPDGGFVAAVTAERLGKGGTV